MSFKARVSTHLRSMTFTAIRKRSRRKETNARNIISVRHPHRKSERYYAACPGDIGGGGSDRGGGHEKQYQAFKSFSY